MPFPTDNFRRPTAVARFVLACVLGLALDLWTKAYSFDVMWVPPTPASNEPAAIAAAQAEAARDTRPHKNEFIPGWLQFENVKNRGAVFGIGQGKRPLFLAVSVLAIGFLTYLFAASGRQRLYQVVLGLLLAGVLGNMYDRVTYGYVRDMIHILPGWNWPGTWHLPFTGYPGSPENPAVPREVFPFIFNVADVWLCVGVFFMIAFSLLAKDEKPEKKADEVKATPA
ncbi:MAG: signal peptidase II [Phycisphaerae bacterium]|nr:signal peptidase II [Tepidisphaeraceae bacterium]